MSTLISVTSWTKLDGTVNAVATDLKINRDFILSVRTKSTAAYSTGITEVIYAMPVNETNTQAVLIVTETAATVLSAINAVVSGSGQSGRATLVAGTVTVSVPGLTSANNVVVSMLTPNTTTLTTEYQAVAGTDSIVIRANVAAGTINSADVSTLVYVVVG